MVQSIINAVAKWKKRLEKQMDRQVDRGICQRSDMTHPCQSCFLLHNFTQLSGTLFIISGKPMGNPWTEMSPKEFYIIAEKEILHS